MLTSSSNWMLGSAMVHLKGQGFIRRQLQSPTPRMLNQHCFRGPGCNDLGVCHPPDRHAVLELLRVSIALLRRAYRRPVACQGRSVRSRAEACNPKMNFHGETER